jgi:CHASE2 domain-containing sensor protein
MPDRAKAITYGILIACAVSIVLLILDTPSATNLLIAIGLGIAGGLGSYYWMINH